MIRVMDGEIKEYKLPKTGRLKSGVTISGYHLLSAAILKDEGWLPLEDNPPSYDAETHYLQADGYEVLADKVVKKYLIVETPEPTAEEIFQRDLPILISALTTAVRDERICNYT